MIGCGIYQDERAAARIPKDGLNVVEDVAPVVVKRKRAVADDRLRDFVEDPVGDVDVVRAEFGQETGGGVAVEPPVDEAFECGVGQGPPPVVVAMPVTEDVGNFADLAGADAFDSLAVPRRIAVLMADLKPLPRLPRRRDDSVAIVQREAHDLLAVDVQTAL